jgi:DNA-binding YbaB/EbfC family protein
MAKGLSGFGDLMKQAQAIQERLQQVQDEAGRETVEASAGGGLVTVTVSGRLEVVGLVIDPSVLEANDPDMLRDLVIAAVNEGIRKAQQMMAEEMGKITGGLGLKLPGLG